MTPEKRLNALINRWESEYRSAVAAYDLASAVQVRERAFGAYLVAIQAGLGSQAASRLWDLAHHRAERSKAPEPNQIPKEHLKYGDYYGSAEVDLESKKLYGRVLFIDDLVNYSGNTVEELEAAFQEAVDDYIDFCEEVGDTPNRS